MKPFFPITIAALLFAAALLYFTGFIGDSSARIRRDHSMTLPASASDIRCDGPFSFTFTDTAASASLEIASADLPALLSQFTWQADPDGNGITSSGGWMAMPERFAGPVTTRRGVSRDGNVIYLRSYDLGNGRTGIGICTLWN